MRRSVILILVILGAAFGFIFWGNRQAAKLLETQDVTQMCVQHYNLGMHIHSHLKIIIDGQEQIIPANIGVVSPTCFRPIHTHDTSGEIHLEFPKVRDVRLAEFFAVWGKPFNSNQIFDFQNGSPGRVKMFVNGRENTEFENYIMKNGDKIVIIYE